MNKRLTEIVEQLDESRSILLGLVADLDQADFDNKPAEGVWSVGEIVHHLLFSEGGVNRILDKLIQRAQQKGIPAETNQESVLHTLDNYDLTRVRKKIKAPKGAVPDFGTPKDELLESLKTSRSNFMASIGKASDFDLTQLSFPHPMIGKLNMYQWLLFVDHHERRHTKQLKELLN